MFKTYVSQPTGPNEYMGYDIEALEVCGLWFARVIDYDEDANTDDGVEVGDTEMCATKEKAIKKAKQLIDTDQIPMY